MKINNLKLTDFRNHKDLDINFGGNSIIIIGENGSGKTNILESIFLLSSTKSLRASHDRETISHDKDMTRIEAEINTNGDTKAIEMLLIKNPNFENMSSKRVKINKVSKSLKNFAGTLSSTLFTPHDVELLTDSPSKRRKYLDLIFYQIDRKYKQNHSDFTKAMRHRNKILEQMRETGSGKGQLEFWNKKILETGEFIQKRRKDFFDFIKSNIDKYAKALNEEEIDYKVDYLINEISKERLEGYENAERGAARTLVGPHRDDFQISLNGYDVAKYGSRGQKRVAMLALKLCEIDFLTEFLGKRPLLLLDDIFSELDEMHRKAVLNIIDKQQTIITSAEKIPFLDHIESIHI